MSRLSERAAAPEARLSAGHPELRRTEIRRARERLVRLVRASSDPSVNRSAKIVFAELVEFLNVGTLECWPSMERLAARVGLKVRATHGHLRALERAGFLHWLPRATRSGRLSNSYRFNFGLVGFPDLYEGAAVPPRVKRKARNAARAQDGTFASGGGPERARAVQAGREAVGLDGGPARALPPGSDDARSHGDAARRFYVGLKAEPLWADAFARVGSADLEARAIRAELVEPDGWRAVLAAALTRPAPGA